MPIFKQSPVTIRFGVATTIVLSVYTDAGAVATSPTGTISVYDNYGTNKLLDAACTAGTGTLSYTLASNLATESALAWTAVWKVTVSSAQYEYTAIFDYAKRLLTIPILTSHVEARDARIKGKYTAGETTFQRQIDEAWKIVISMLRATYGVRYLESMIDSNQLSELMIWKSLELIYHEMIAGDPATSTYALAEKQAAERFKYESTKSIIVDYDDDNAPDGEMQASFNLNVGR